MCRRALGSPVNLRRLRRGGYWNADQNEEAVRPHALLSDAEMQSPALLDRIVGFARLALPLLEWGWTAIDEETPAPLPIRAPIRPLPKPDF
jgi:hypothetical protein